MSSSPEASPPPAAEAKKRKRTSTAAEDELEIDVNLPEPPSKKAARKAKKAKPSRGTDISLNGITDSANPQGTKDETKPSLSAATASDPAKRSAHGIWIGNLPFSTTKPLLREFFTDRSIADEDITRVHLPLPPNAEANKNRALKPQNRGFAYVDFATKEVLDKAIALSETLLSGRKVLIKDAKSFEGRPEGGSSTTKAALGIAEPEKVADGKAARAGGDSKFERTKRVFVGNLGFDVSKEDLEGHFAQAGTVEDVHMATFEDTGKCKGYAWVRFEDEDAAEAAVKGFVWKDQEGEDGASEQESEDDTADAEEESGDEDSEKKKTKKTKKAKKLKPRKWFINRLYGRTLRCEFAEDAATRYKKRFGKAKPEQQDGAVASDGLGGGDGAQRQSRPPKADKYERKEQRKQKNRDARTIAPGAALANAPRASGAIVESQGKRTTFDE